MIHYGILPDLSYFFLHKVESEIFLRHVLLKKSETFCAITPTIEYERSNNAVERDYAVR